VKLFSAIALAAAFVGFPEFAVAQQASAEAAELSVPMEVAKARVEKIKELMAAVSSGNAAGLAKLKAPAAIALMGDKQSPLTVGVIQGLKDCTKRGAFQVSEDQVVFFTECVGTSMPAETTVIVDFVEERISKIETMQTVFVPTPVPSPSGER
jgi:hypothetical protein